MEQEGNNIKSTLSKSALFRRKLIERRLDVADPERFRDQLAMRVRGRKDIAAARSERKGNAAFGERIGDRPALFVAPRRRGRWRQIARN